MRPGEIYLANFPYGDRPEMKVRPVLLLTGATGPVPEVLVAYISSVVPPPEQLLPSDLVLNPGTSEFASTRLKVVSALRLHKLATLHCAILERYLGVLDRAHAPVVSAKLKALLDL